MVSAPTLADSAAVAPVCVYNSLERPTVDSKPAVTIATALLAIAIPTPNAIPFFSISFDNPTEPNSES